MKRLKKPIKTILSTTIVALLANHSAEAGSFSLYTESTARAIGNYAAGIAAEASDASTGWYNPAGLALLGHEELVLGGVGVFPSSKLTGTATFITSPYPSYMQNFNNLQGAQDALVPSLHYARPFRDNMAFGLSIVTPFGLVTDWGTKGPLRYSATKSKLLTADVSPEVGVRISPNLAAGAGLDLQYARVTFNSVLGAPTLLMFIDEPATAFDSTSTNKGDSFAVGFHAGIMLISDSQHSRLGFNYQSAIAHKFRGTSRLKGPLASLGIGNPNAVFESDELTSNRITLPDVLTLSGYHDLNESWALLGSIVYTAWQSLSSIELNNVAAFNEIDSEPALMSSRSIVDYKNTWRFAGGVNYKVNPQWMLRAGGGYDQTPTNDAHRDVRIPDCSRWALALGAHYQARPNVGLDLGYTHLFEASDAVINNGIVLGESTSLVQAKAKNAVDLVGLQVTWLMDEVVPVMTK